MAARFLIVSAEPLGQHAQDILYDSGLAATVVTSTHEALEHLQHAVSPVALDLRIPEAEAFLSTLRADHALSGTPVVALVSVPTDTAFSTAFAWGVDEVLPAESLGDLPAIARAILRLDFAERPPSTRGTVVLASASPAERRMRSRPLSSAGFSVVFASNPDELLGALDREGVAFVLADTELFAPDAIRRIRGLISADARRHPWVLVSSNSAIPELLMAFHDLPVGVVNRNASPDDSLFIGNDLLKGDATEGRASPRLLHATVASFRAEGTLSRRYGITYNLSREGLYVRTLNPPPVGSRVWVEVRPLAGEHVVHLEATVVWTRSYNTPGGATAPAGFGARITDGTARDLERWREGYSRLTMNFSTVRPGAYLSKIPSATA